MTQLLQPHAYRETLVAFIRDVGHAYLALSDRRDWPTCVATVDSVYTALVRTGDFALLPRVRRADDISHENALLSLAHAVQLAKRHLRELDEYERHASSVPTGLAGFVDESGRKVLLILAVALNTFLCHGNVWQTWLRAKPAAN